MPRKAKKKLDMRQMSPKEFSAIQMRFKNVFELSPSYLFRAVISGVRDIHQLFDIFVSEILPQPF